MIRPVAVIDSDVLILLLDNTDNPDLHDTKGYVELAIENLVKQNARFVVPAPVVAELCRGGPGSLAVREIARTLLRDLRVEVLDEDAADVAGQISRTTLQERAGRERGAVKFDALIAGIAHRIAARWLLTGNRSDYRRCFAAIQSPVEVIVATAPPAKGQQVLVKMLKPGSAPASQPGDHGKASTARKPSRRDRDTE